MSTEYRQEPGAFAAGLCRDHDEHPCPVGALCDAAGRGTPSSRRLMS